MLCDGGLEFAFVISFLTIFIFIPEIVLNEKKKRRSAVGTCAFEPVSAQRVCSAQSALLPLEGAGKSKECKGPGGTGGGRRGGGYLLFLSGQAAGYRQHLFLI